MSPLHLAVDAQAMIGWGPTGVANYAANLTRAIGRSDAENDYLLPYFWSPRRRRPTTPAQLRNFRYRRVPLPMPAVQFLERRGVDLAWDRLVGRLDACLFPGLWVRPLRRGGSVRVVHDLNYVVHPETLPAVRNAAADWIENFRVTLPRIATLVAISNTVKSQITEHFGVEPGRIDVAPPAADRSVFHARSDGEVERARRTHHLDREYILHTGTLEPRKNAPSLIAAFRKVDAARSGDVTLALVGPTG